jgi:putative addiction module component (TIGR02574 family)
MKPEIKKVYEAAMQLSQDDCAELVDLINIRFLTDPTIDQAWNDEIDRRVSEYERGDAKLVDLDDVLAKLRRVPAK